MMHEGLRRFCAQRGDAVSSDGNAPGANRAALIVGLLTVAVFINYIDRGTLATAAPLLKHDLHLTNTQFGLVTSAFFWAYTPGQLLASWVTERINAYRALAAGFAIWSVATALTGFAGGFLSLIALRVLLGIGEASASPAGSKLVVDHLVPTQFGLASGIVGAGLAFGPSAGTLLGGLLMAQYGWRAMFAVFGVLALVWLWPWFAVTRGARTSQLQLPVPAPSYAELLSQRPLWGAVFGQLASNYALYFLLGWLPLYLVNAQGFSVGAMAGIGASVYAIYGVCGVIVGWLADRWVARGASLTLVRKSVVVTGHVGLGLCLLGAALSGRDVAVICLLASGVFCGCIVSAMPAITQTLAGPPAAAKWTAFQNMMANIAGIVSPIVTGFVVDQTGSFLVAFLMASASAFIGIIGWLVIVQRVEPVQWSGQNC
jgi:MFS family permease